ncbi:unnamed protein product [Lupinus luteus]|uniref:Sieve element occlusion N-terminal domain-containing protein n=1 Tax=Lupinus luteus TaxID=3873 RepID=A0AAV1WC03_LUPLU
MEMLGMLSSYSWDDEVVIALAALSATFGEFWLVAQLYATLPPTLLLSLNAMLNVTKCIIEFQGLLSQYIDPEAPEKVIATILIGPLGVLWLTGLCIKYFRHHGPRSRQTGSKV